VTSTTIFLDQLLDIATINGCASTHNPAVPIT
jgi:hypothetical protein